MVTKSDDVSGCHFGVKASVVELGVVNVTVILWEAAVPMGMIVTGGHLLGCEETLDTVVTF